MSENQEGYNISPYQSPMHNYGSSILLLTNPGSELHKLEMTYRGLQETEDGQLYRTGNPWMNDEGINSVIGIAKALVNQVTVMSNLDKKEIPMIMDFLADTLAKDLMMNRVKYDILNPSVRDKIYFTTLSTCFVTLKRAQEQGERIFWKNSVQEIRTTVDNPQKKGFLSKIMPWS